jgi:hypothetical protein
MHSRTRSFCALLLLSAFASPLACGGDEPGPKRGREAEAGAGGEGVSSSGGAGGEAGGDAGGEGGAAVASYDAFDAFREMQGVLRQSPDHWAARAEALVAAADVEGLFELVRDDIAVIPGRGGFFDAGASRRFGARAALRGGMGTLRERADLLRDLVVQAGHDAEVYVGDPEPDFDLDALLARPANRTVSFVATATQRARWASVLPEPAAGFMVAALDGEGERVAAVEEMLLAAGVTSAEATDIDWDLRAIPFVRATIDGEDVDLNPNVRDAEFGEARVLEPEPAPEAGPLDSITVRLSVARANAPGEEIPVVEKTWSADELVGRTVTAAFATPHSLIEAAATSAEDAQSFIPLLSVRGAGLGDDEAHELSAVGDTFTRGGERITLNDDGSLLFGDELVAPPPSDPELLAAVEGIEIAVDEAAFPEVSVFVTARDGGGRLVSDLAADAFVLEEDGEPVPAVLGRSRAPAPKVTLLFDRSTSLPAEFLENAAVTGRTIAEALFEAVPDVEVQIAGMDFNGPTLAGGFVSTVEEVDAQLATLAGAASEIWTNLSAFSKTDAAIVVAISDFVPEDLASADFTRAIADGPPVLAVAVGEADLEVADRVAALSSGSRFDGEDADGVAAAAAEFVALRNAYSYRLVYRAKREGAATRDVRLAFDDARLDASDEYTPPEMPAPIPALSGIFLSVATNGLEVKRTLAGSPASPASELAIEEADAMLFGRAVLGVEAGPPSLSSKLDEHIGERLALEPVVDAAVAEDGEALMRAVASARTRTPANLRFAFSAGPDELEGPATYPEGVSTALYVERPRWERATLRSLDWLPLVPRRTALRDPVEAFEATLRRTAYLAAIEEARFEESTLSLLDGDELALFEPNAIDAELGAAWYAPVSQYRDRLIAAPIDGAPLAFFTVNRYTGDVIGGLPDGTGGAIAAEVEQTLAQIESILSVAERAGEVGGFNGIAVWVQLERTKAQIVGAVTILLGEGTQPDFAGIFEDAIAGAVEDGITGEIPGWDDAFGPVDDLGDIYDGIEAFTGNEMPDVGAPSFTD